LFPLHSLYALERGATIELAGMVLAGGFLGLAVGSMTATRLSRLVGRDELAYVVAALIQACAYTLMGRATELWQVVALLASAWIGAGQAVTVVQVMVGRAVSAERRGRAFGLLALAPPLGALLGASLLGAIAKGGGYEWAYDAGAMLVLGAGLMMAAVMAAEEADEPKLPSPGPRARTAANWSVAELGLLLSVLLASTAQSFGQLATPVTMRALGFDPQAIAATAAIGGLVTAPFILLIGEMSDRLGRRPMLVGSSVLIAVASIVLAFADQYWQFSLAAALLALGVAITSSASAALAGDLIPMVMLPHTLARLSTITWVGAVIAFGGGGALLGHVGAPVMCLGAAILALSGSLLVVVLRGRQRQGASLASARRAPPLPARQRR
jgi:MFS family permease